MWDRFSVCFFFVCVLVSEVDGDLLSLLVTVLWWSWLILPSETLAIKLVFWVATGWFLKATLEHQYNFRNFLSLILLILILHPWKHLLVTALIYDRNILKTNEAKKLQKIKTARRNSIFIFSFNRIKISEFCYSRFNALCLIWKP